MALSISDLNGNRFAEIKSVSVSGLPGCGNYILYLRLSASIETLEDEVILSQLACRIEVGESNLRCANGAFEGHPAINWHQNTNDYQFGFLFYLSGAQMSAIESIRNSCDLDLGVWLSGEICHKDKRSTFMNKGDFTIPKQEWIEAIGLMKYKHILLFELPMPKDSVEKDIQLLLERAQSHILNGHYQESVGLCRQAIEVIEKINDDKVKAQDAVKKHKNQRADMSVKERMLSLREALKNIAHLGSHHADDFSRKQAQAILGVTVSLLSCPEVGIQE